MARHLRTLSRQLQLYFHVQLWLVEVSQRNHTCRGCWVESIVICSAWSSRDTHPLLTNDKWISNLLPGIIFAFMPIQTSSSIFTGNAKDPPFFRRSAASTSVRSRISNCPPDKKLNLSRKLCVGKTRACATTATAFRARMQIALDMKTHHAYLYKCIPVN